MTPPIVIVVLAAIALGLPAVAGAQAESQVEVTHDRVLVSGFDVCSGAEVAGVEGRITQVERMTIDAAGGLHTASITTAVAASRDGVIINHQADAGPTNLTSNGTSTNTDAIQVLVVRPGPGPDSIEHINTHTTVAADGSVVSNPVNVLEACHG